MFSVALSLISSVRGSLFLHWPYFVYAIASSICGYFKVLLLRSVTRSDLQFSLSDEVARWDESLLFFLAPSLSTPVVSSGFSRMFPVFPPCLFIRNFLSSFLFLPGFHPLSWWVSFPSYFQRFFSFGLPYLFAAFTSPVLFRSSVGCFAVSFLGLGFLPSGYLFPRPYVFLPWFGVSPFRVSLPSSLCLSALGPFGCRASFLGSGLFLWALHLSCASSPYCLFRPWAFPSLPRSWFLSSHSSSSIFLSAWCFLYFLGCFSSGFSSVSSSGGSLLSFCRSVLLGFTPLSFRVRSFRDL